MKKCIPLILALSFLFSCTKERAKRDTSPARFIGAYVGTYSGYSSGASGNATYTNVPDTLFVIADDNNADNVVVIYPYYYNRRVTKDGTGADIGLNDFNGSCSDDGTLKPESVNLTINQCSPSHNIIINFTGTKL
jgi:hypothetical protein